MSDITSILANGITKYFKDAWSREQIEESGSKGHKIMDGSIVYPSRRNLQFINSSVEDDETNNTTTVTINVTNYVKKPVVTVDTYIYDGSELGPTIDGLTEDMVVTNAKKIDAGTYTLTISLKDISSMMWTDSTTADLTYVYTIQKRVISIPTVSGEYTFDTNIKSAIISDLDDRFVTIIGTRETANAGLYNITFDLNNKDGMVWSDNSTSIKSGSWKINKSDPVINTNVSEINLSHTKLYENLIINTNATEEFPLNVTVRIENPELITSTFVSDNPTTYKIMVDNDYIGNDQCLLFIKANGNDNFNEKEISISVKLDMLVELNDCSWERISEISESGRASSIWNIGDMKEITLNGKVGDYLSLTNYKTYVYIIGFDHNSAVEGTGISFGCFKTEDGTPIALADSEYELSSHVIYYSNGTTQYILDETTNTWNKKTWSGNSYFNGQYVWTDGNDIYYSEGPKQYVLDKTTSTWETKTWNGVTNFYGSNVWTDCENIYYTNDENHYVLNKSTSTWETKTWTGITVYDPQFIWTDGENIYYSDGGRDLVLDKASSTWSTKTWNGLTEFYGNHVWTDGANIYYSYSSNVSKHYILNRSTDTWTTKTWNGLTDFTGFHIWTAGKNTYCSNGSSQYVLNKTTSTWTKKTWSGLTNFYGYNVWSDIKIKTYTINHWEDPLKNSPLSYGGWKACDMRYDILGSTDVAPSNYGSYKNTLSTGYTPTQNCKTNPVPDTLMAALPSDLRSVMKLICKYTDNGYEYGDSTSEELIRAVTNTYDYLPLLSLYELDGKTDYINSYEKNMQKQYDYYKNGNFTHKYNHVNIGQSPCNYWLRSRGLMFNNIKQSKFSCYYRANSIEPMLISYALAPVFLV